MYLFKTSIKKSNIQGTGVFADSNIPENSVVWKFVHNHDLAITNHQYESLSDSDKLEMEKVGYLSPSTGLWIYPPENDNARYTNHSATNANLTARFDPEISTEIIFVANRNIESGEELLNNYLEFDEFIKTQKPYWI